MKTKISGKNMVIGMVTGTIILAALFIGVHLVAALPPGYFQWIQSNWSGGKTSNNAAHPSNDTNWAQYSSDTVDPNIKVVGGKITLLPFSTPITDNFTAGTPSGVLNNVQRINGTGLELKATKTDPFASGLGQWRSLPAIPAFCQYSAYTRMNGYIYCATVSGDGKQFGRYSMATQTWQFLAPLPVPVGAGCAITGDGEYIYALRGSGSTQVYYYDPATDQWARLMNKDATVADLPTPALEGARIVNVGGKIISGTGTLYVATGGGRFNYSDSGYGFYYHTQNRVGWPDLTGVNTLKTLGCKVALGSELAAANNCLYLEPGNGSSKIFKYDLGNPGQGWAQITSGPTSIYPNDARFDSNGWYGMWYPSGGDYLYCIMYSSNYPPNNWWENLFYRYGPLSGSPSWTRLNDLPNSPQYSGSCSGMMYDAYDSTNNAATYASGQSNDPDAPAGTNQTIYYLSGDNYTRPWKYSVTNNKWMTLNQVNYYFASAPPSGAIVRGGDSYSDYIYVLPASGYNGLACYSISQNNWTYTYSNPFTGVDHPGDKLTYLNGKLYCLPVPGENANTTPPYIPSTHIYSYTLPSGPWDTASITLPPGVSDVSKAGFGYSGSGLIGVSNNGKNYLYFILGHKTNSFYYMDTSDNSWHTPAMQPQLQLPISIYTATMCYPGYQEADGFTYIYAAVSPMSGSNTFFKYGPVEYDTNPSAYPGMTAAWAAAPGGNLPVGMSSDYYPAHMAYGTDATGRHLLYYINGIWYAYDTPNFYAYDIDARTWSSSLEKVPNTTYHSTGPVSSSDGKSVYFITHYGYGDNTFWKYDTLTKKWNEPVTDSYRYSYGKVTQDSNKNIYLIGTDSSSPCSHFWVYSPSAARWVGLIRAPFVLTLGASGEYVPADNAIYLSKGGSSILCKYDMNQTPPQWSSIGALTGNPAPFFYGSQLVAGNGHTLYINIGGGNSSRTIYQYYTDGDYSVNLTTLNGFGFTDQCQAMTFNPNTNSLYVVNPANADFYSIDCNNGAPHDPVKLVKVGDTVGDGVNFSTTTASTLAISYPGFGNYLYCIPSSGTSNFLRYDVTGGQSGTWERRADMPVQTIAAMSGIASGVSGDPCLYVCNPAIESRFLRYMTPESNGGKDLWNESNSTVPMTYGSSLCGYKGHVYFLVGYGSSNFYNYDTASNTWMALSPCPSNFLNAGNNPIPGVSMLPLEYGGNAYIYVTGGINTSTIYRYSLAEDTWTSISTPFPFGWGNCMAKFGDCLYVLQGTGDGSVRLMKYDMKNNIWLASMDSFAAQPVDRGASMTNVNDSYLYLLTSGQSPRLYKYPYNPATQTLAALPQNCASCPVTVNSGQSDLVYPGFGKYIYYLQGSSGYESQEARNLFKYDMDLDKWVELTPAPFGIISPGKIVYPGGESLYMMSGNGKAVFTSYYIFCVGDYISDIKEVGTHCSWGLLDWNDNGKASILAGVRTGDKSNLSDASDWSGTVNIAKGSDLSTMNISSVKQTDKYMQYKINFATDDSDNLPSLSNLTINYNKYPPSATMISSLYNTTFDTNRLRAASWSADLGTVSTDLHPIGTAVSLQLRSTKDSTISPGLPDSASWTEWLGPTGTRTANYNFSNANDYAASSEIDISSGYVKLLKELQDFKFARAITVTNNSTTLTTPVNDVCVLNITSADSHFWDNINSNGSDIRFYDIGTNQMLHYRLISFDKQNKNAVISVRLPASLATSSSMAIYLIYGNRGAFSQSDDTVSSFYKFKTDSSLSLISWWDINNVNFGSNVVPDSNGNSYLNLVSLNSTALTQGPFGNAYRGISLNGINSWMWAANTGLYRYTGGDRTMSAWVKSKGDPDGGFLFGSYDKDNFYSGINSGGTISLTIYNNTGVGNSGVGFSSSKPLLQDGKWHNITEVLTGPGVGLYSYYQIYLDGVLVASRTYAMDNTWNVPYVHFTVGNYCYYSSWGSGYLLKSDVSLISVYNTALTATQIKYLSYAANPDLAASYNTAGAPPANTYTTGKFYSDSPVIMPVFGLFYDKTNNNDILSSFINVINSMPSGTNIKCQVSPDGYNWYWYNGGWQLVSLGSSQSNTAGTISSNLASFVNITLPNGSSARSGDFYWRAYIQSDGTATPELNSVSISATSGVSYYTDNTGGQAINSINTDATGDQWVQYKVTLYSDGQNAPVLNNVTLNCVQGKIMIQSPIGGEEWPVGSTENITWTSQGFDDQINGVDIDYFSASQNQWVNIVTTTPNTGTYVWTSVPVDPSTSTKIRIRSHDLPAIYAESNNFKIMGLELTGPAAGQIWEQGSNHDITWQTSGYTSGQLSQPTLFIDYSFDGGATWYPVVDQQQPGTGLYTWHGVDSPPIDSELIRIYDTNPALCYGGVYIDPTSCKVIDMAGPISIIPAPTIRVDSPTGTGVQLIAGQNYTISWHTNSKIFASKFIIEYSKDDFLGDIHPIAEVDSGAPASAPSDPNTILTGSYTWTAPNDYSNNVKIRVKEKDGTLPSYRDTQIAVFGDSVTFTVVAPYVSITQPDPADPDIQWVVGDTDSITWTLVGNVQGPLAIDYSINYSPADPGSATWNPIPGASDVSASSGSYSWTIPSAVSDNAYIRITDTSSGGSQIISRNFKIIPHEKIVISTPPAGVNVTIGVPYDIRWKGYGRAIRNPNNYLYIYYSSDGGATYTQVPGKANLSPNDSIGANGQIGNYLATWRFSECPTGTPLQTSTNAKLKICTNPPTNDPYLLAETDVFNVLNPTIIVTAPAAEGNWYATGTYTITWTEVGTPSNSFKISYWDGTQLNQIYSGTGITDLGPAGPGQENYSYNWKVSDSVGSGKHVQIMDNNRTAVVAQSGNFNIVAPTISITSPNSGTQGANAWVAGAKYPITWTTTGGDVGAISALRVDCIVGGTVVSSQDITDPSTLRSNDGTIAEWTVPDEAVRTNASIHIYDPARPTTTATQQFEISPPAIFIDSPAVGDTWRIGSAGHAITWRTLGSVQYPLRISCIMSNGETLQIADIPAAIPPALSYAWAVDTPGIVAGAAKIIIDDSHTTPIETVMAQSFMIASPNININGPLPGEMWTETSTNSITWTYDGKVDAPLTIQWSNDNFASAHTIGSITGNPTNFLSYPWTIPHEAVGPNVQIRITDGSTPQPVISFSPVFNVFPIPTLTITQPNSTNFAGQAGGAWLIGNRYTIAWTTNGGSISNDLKLQYTIDSGASYIDIANHIPSKGGTYEWVIDHSAATAPSTRAQIRITDNVAWKTGTYLDTALPPCPTPSEFEIGLPIITVTSPTDTDFIAVKETPVIRWDTSGYINDDLSLALVKPGDNGFAPISIKSAYTNIHQYAGWQVPDTILPGLYAIKITDDSSAYGGQSGKVIGISRSFNIIQEPQLTVVTPNGGAADDYVIDSSTIHFRWSSEGLSVINVKIELSSDNFATSYTVVASTPNTGSYDWFIRPDPGVPAGTNVKARIARVDTVPDYGKVIYDDSDTPFTIRSGFVFSSPSPTVPESWATNETRNIAWTTKGSIAKVNLYYSLDGGTTYQQIAGAQGIDNTGAYAWKVPNPPTRPATARLKIEDASDTQGLIKNESPTFSIIWYTIKFYVIDIDNFDPLGSLNVSDAAEGAWDGWSKWEVTNNSLNSPQDTFHEYPYGKYQVTWNTTEAANYFARTVEFTADSNNKTILVQMENKISAQLEWHVIVSTVYQPDTDTVEGQAWLERRGTLQEPPLGEGGSRNYTNFHIFTIGVYDYDNPDPAAPPILSYVADSTLNQLPDTTGVYKFKWQSTGLKAGKTYFVRATMKYGAGEGQIYKSGTTIDITMPKTQYDQSQQLGAVVTAVTSTLPAQIQTATDTIKTKLDETRTSLETKVDTSTKAIKDETAKILTATGTESIPEQIKAARNTVRSEILNRESIVRSGQTIAIKYRTPSTSAFIDVYDANNIQRINKQPMLPLPASGTNDLNVFQYLVNFDQGWDRGDFTIVCSDSAGNMDALMMAVTSATVEDVAGNVAAILGNTASMNEFKDVAENLNSQFNVIETVLTKLGKEMTTTAGAAQNAAMMDSVYNQLNNLSKQMKQVTGKTNLSLDKLYKVSADKKSDMMYLKNKTQELKAAMEINNQMVSNMANKPVTQTWYEYK